jgi:DNA-binding transcriptional LysR family regulator
MIVFRAVATEKSFSRAAAKIFKTQPAVSQAVRLLEDELGEKLFLRLGRTIELTQAGRILLEHVEDALGSLDEARGKIQALKELRTGELTIATSDTTACYLLPPVLEEFRRRYPQIEVKILNRVSGAAAAKVAAHEADIGVVTLPVAVPKLVCEPLVLREDVGVCAPSHALARRKRVSFAEFVRHPLLLLDRGSSTRAFIEARIERTGAVPNVAMELGSIEVIKKLVELGFGASIVPRIAIQQEIERGTLRALLILRKSDHRTLGIVYPAKGAVSLAARVFAKLLRGHNSMRSVSGTSP